VSGTASPIGTAQRSDQSRCPTRPTVPGQAITAARRPRSALSAARSGAGVLAEVTAGFPAATQPRPAPAVLPTGSLFSHPEDRRAPDSAPK
jgi:hypothetical protein